MANIITGCRILGSVFLLFIPVFSPTFYFFYLLTGITDIMDGFVARRTNTVSELGSKLDTIADFSFIAVCLIKLLPILKIPVFLLVWIGAIAIIKVINVISGFIVKKKFMAVHSFLNKLTGAMLFAFPLSLLFV
ncbi:MAG: CDP-alcohol phosphatidyltransferase family protein, partial [Lachnospiraceae bacterium]|nr:CDP-alcohol phosphatidyltransferase family protein [Lachnospiraceae bacterium]